MLQADGTDVVGRCVSCQCLELVEETRTAHVLDFTEGVHVEIRTGNMFHNTFSHGGNEFPVQCVTASFR